VSALRKTKARSHGSRRFLGKARANWLYTQPEVQTLFGVCPNTIRNWRRNGLRSFKANVRLFLGRDLNAFHRRCIEEAKRPCAPGEVFCVCCKQKHSLLDVPLSIDGKGRFRTRLLITCPVTGGTSATYVSETDFASLIQRRKHNPSPGSGDSYTSRTLTLLLTRDTFCAKFWIGSSKNSEGVATLGPFAFFESVSMAC